MKTPWPSQRPKLLVYHKHLPRNHLTPVSYLSIAHSRRQSTTTTANVTSSYPQPQPQSPPSKQPPLAVLPTKSLLRSLLFTSVMSSPLLEPCLFLMRSLVNSKSALLDPAKNAPLNYLLRSTIYNHFCAGENETEVKQTVQYIKDLGFKGVILGNARDVVVDHEDSRVGGASDKRTRDAAYTRMVQEWKEGNLKTLAMIESGDFLAVK